MVGDGIRVLAANEPVAYREVVAAALGHLRPRVEVLTADPAELDAAVIRAAPHVVVCSNLTEVVRTRALGWVLLYPGGENRGVVSVGGVEATVEAIEFDALLSVVDETGRLVNGRLG
jgi:hypothetical protein